MAKKVLTPEEVQAKLEKKAAKRKLFFGTFTKALAFFLAIAMVYSLAIIAFTPQTITTGAPTQSGSTSNGFEDYDDGSSNAGNAGTGDAGNAGTGDAGNAGNADQTADVIKAFNDATAKAAGGSYHWTRKGEFTKDVAIDPAVMTKIVNGIITAVDSNSNLNSVVGGFIGIADKEADVVGGKAPEGMDAKYLLKASTITAADVKSATVSGNQYTIKIKDTANPSADSAMGRATNDYITIAEVNESIASFTTAISVKESSQANYKNMVIVATIENGNLTNLTYSYEFEATLDLSISAKGTGAAKITATYSNIK